MLLKLRPVTFRYREEVAAEGAAVRQYGLVAEEVAQLAPELVALDTEGRPYSVRYHLLPSMLLNEVQKQQRADDEHAALIEGQTRVIEEQRQVVAALEDRLERVEAKLAAAPAGTDR